MRRTTRKAVTHLSMFGAILCIILFTNRPQSGSKTFSWDKIRYQTNAKSLPEARGLCPGLGDTTKPALVVARVMSDDSRWLEALSSKYHLCIYASDASLNPKSTHLQVPANRGHEAMAYLTFLIDNYASIPSSGAVFIHGSRFAWHNDDPDYDNAALLEALDIPSALKEWGYHNLRCDWSLSTCPADYVPQGSLDTSMQAVLEPWDRKAVSDAAMPDALRVLFGGDRKIDTIGRAQAVRSQCCAQFVVSREQIWEHGREEYVALRQWLLDGGGGQNKKTAPADDRVAGRILSYVWHILFMKHELVSAKGGLDLDILNVGACSSAKECYCRLYGRCGLGHCTAGKCLGQYRLPKDLKLPDNWEEKHS